MNDIIVGAAIVLITLFVEETLRYFYSVRVEKQKIKLKQQEDTKNFRLNSIKEMKEELVKLRIQLFDSCSVESRTIIPFEASDFSDILRELHRLKSNFFTFPETKDLGLLIQILIQKFYDFEGLIKRETDCIKIKEPFRELMKTIQMLEETPL